MAGHNHHHHGIDPATGDRMVFWAIVVNLALTVAQIVGGLLSGSLALIADAIHNLSDAFALVIAYFARRIARRPADANMTFGYGRAEIVAALINYTALIIISVYLAWEAVWRMFDPSDVDGWLVVVIAGIALVIDTATALLTYAMSKQSMNIRAAFLHNVADALGSVGVIVAGTLIVLYDWRLVDPIVTLAIAGYILWQSVSEVGQSIRVLMLGSPAGVELPPILAALDEIEGISGVHHVHFWQMQEHETALDAHLVIDSGRWKDADAIKIRAKTLLKQKFGIGHTTLELECAVHACDDIATVGHDSSHPHAMDR
jgi:cobalt-zinc-cadmium efflux system protein